MYFYIKSKFELIKKTSACKVIAYLENSHIHIAAFFLANRCPSVV